MPIILKILKTKGLAVCVASVNAIGSLIVLVGFMGASMEFALIICSIYTAVMLISLFGFRKGELLLSAVNSLSLLCNVTIITAANNAARRWSHYDNSISALGYVMAIFATAAFSLIFAIFIWACFRESKE